MEQELFVSGDLLAGRYRMIERIGRGGMGDVWRADDLVLKTPVALKLLRSAGPTSRAHILQEVRLARQITHPAVCRVFDVGEAGDTVFFSMELVQGEDLATLIDRIGRLPSDRVVQIARQLCAGLAAAHAQGVLHRDLKPANILIDEAGRPRITDFGIAIPSRGGAPHAMVGTLGYMAPEQLEPGAALTERTDIYALGVVLYELVTGQPFAGAARSAGPELRPSSLAPHAGAQLERAILKALSHNPDDRHAHALAMLAELPDLDEADVTAAGGSFMPRTRRWTRSWIAGGAAAAIVALAAGVAPFVWPRGGTLTARDTIVLADFTNTTGDAVFDGGTLKIALAVGLEQSPFLKVFPDERAREDMRLMQRSPDERITPTLARQIAQREQFKALIAGSIAILGQNYVVSLQAVNAETGDVMAREQVEATTKEDVLTALGGAASKLRGRLGESLASIERYDVPLARATTSSLEALQAYSLALDPGRALRLESIPYLKRAIELDPNFALAQAQLSGMYVNTGQSTLAPEYSRRAFELRDRVTERERYFISWRYYRDATQAWDKGLDLARSWMEAYPRESFAFNSFGFAAWSLGQYQQAIDPLREAIRLDPKFVAPPQNLGATLTALDQYDAVQQVLDAARAIGIDYIPLRRVAYLLAFIRKDTAAMTRELEASLSMAEGLWATNWPARVSAFGGRMVKAHDEFQASVASMTGVDFREMAAGYSAQEAESHAVVGQCAEARREAAAAVDLSRDNFTLETVGRTLAWCGAGEEAASVSSELARRFPEAALTLRVIVPVIAAATAITSGDAGRALELLEPVKPFDHAPVAEFWPAYLRGQAHLQMKRGAEAMPDFQSIVDHRGERPDSMLYPLAHLGLARAALVAGDPAKARRSYQAFFDWWKDADPDLRPLSEARLEFARLPQ